METRFGRRHFLVGVAAGTAVLAFDPYNRTWITAAHADPPDGISIPDLDGDHSSLNQSDDSGLRAVGGDGQHILGHERSLPDHVFKRSSSGAPAICYRNLGGLSDIRSSKNGGRRT